MSPSWNDSRRGKYSVSQSLKISWSRSPLRRNIDERENSIAKKQTVVWKHRWFIYTDSYWNSCFTEQISMKTFLELYSQEINNSQFWIQTSNQVKDIICIGHSRSGFVRVDHKALLHHCTEETISSKNILALPFLKGRVLQLGDRSKATPQCLPRY